MIALAAGLLAGVLTSWGVGGGSLLIIYMTAIAGVAQSQAQGINLLYFIPTSASALYMHVKNRLVDISAAVPAICAGVPTTLVAALAAAAIDTEFLRKTFGVFLILMGVSEFFRKDAQSHDEIPSKKGS